MGAARRLVCYASANVTILNILIQSATIGEIIMLSIGGMIYMINDNANLHALRFDTIHGITDHKLLA